MRALRLTAVVLIAASLSFACSEDQSVATGPRAELAPTFAAGGQGKGKKVSYALEFDGASTGTWTADASALDLGSTWTIELWVKPDDAARIDPRQDFVSKWGLGTEASYAFWLRGRTIRLSSRQDPTGNTSTYGVTELADGIWQHVAAVFDNGTVRLYVDGQLDVETTGNFVPQNSVTVLSLGRMLTPRQTTGAWYDGTMDEVRIWSVALSQREIQKNMGDLTGNGHDMQLGNAVGSDTGDPLWVTEGKEKAFSYALDFDGARDGMETPDADDLDLRETFTIEAWVKPHNASGSIQHIVSKWGCCTEASYNLGIRYGPIQLNTRADGANSVNVGVTSLQDDVWQHVAATFDHGTVRLYIDGRLDNEILGARVPQIGPPPVSIGRQHAVTGFKGQFFDGVIDEVRIWNVARTVDQLRDNMNVKLTRKARKEGLIAYWRMDEGEGDLAFDLTGNGHDMQLGDAAGPDPANPAWVTPGIP
jgi:hypothetical protein